jgi:hypothetical protein
MEPKLELASCQCRLQVDHFHVSSLQQLCSRANHTLNSQFVAGAQIAIVQVADHCQDVPHRKSPTHNHRQQSGRWYGLTTSTDRKPLRAGTNSGP